MGVSPPSGQPPSTPASSGGSEGPEDRKVKRKDKEFKLPEKGEKKKKGPEIAGQAAIKEMKQEVSAKGAELKVEETSSIAAKAQVSQVGQLIQRMVAEMKIGSLGGKDFASLRLSEAPDVPGAFQGSNLTLSYAENKLVIRFENFTSPQNEQHAFLLVERNKEQLTQMMQALQSKNIQVTELNIGSRSVTLPRVEPLPPPFQAPPSPEGEGARREGDRRQRERREEPR